MFKRVGDWQVLTFCESCDRVLEWMGEYNDCCRHCGVTGEFSIPHYTRVARWIRTAPLWKFWSREGYWEYKINK